MGSPCGVCELEQVVGGADHCPFLSDLVEPAEKELAKAPGMLDLTEHRLGNLLAQPIATAPARAFELCGHGSNTRSTAPTLATAVGLAVPYPARGDVAVDPAACEVEEIFFRAEASVSGNFLWVGAKYGAHRGQQRFESTGIGRAGLQPLGDDDLMRGIYCYLGIVAGNYARFGGLDPAIRISEVALR